MNWLQSPLLVTPAPLSVRRRQRSWEWSSEVDWKEVGDGREAVWFLPSDSILSGKKLTFLKLSLFIFVMLIGKWSSWFYLDTRKLLSYCTFFIICWGHGVREQLSGYLATNQINPPHLYYYIAEAHSVCLEVLVFIKQPHLWFNCSG